MSDDIHTYHLNCGLMVTFHFPYGGISRVVKVGYRISPALELKLRGGLYGKVYFDSLVRQAEAHSGVQFIGNVYRFWASSSVPEGDYRAVPPHERKALADFLIHRFESTKDALSLDTIRSLPTDRLTSVGDFMEKPWPKKVVLLYSESFLREVVGPDDVAVTDLDFGELANGFSGSVEIASYIKHKMGLV